jgi:ABC-type Fe3+-hydroxamate transport system substrate-binding protein
VADVRELVGILGDLHGREERSTEFIAAVYSQLASMPRQTFTFACPIWKQPWMWCGGDTYVSDLVTCAGGRNVLADRFRYPIVPIEEAMALRPDIIFLPDEPYAFTSDDREEIAKASGSRVIGPFPGHLFTWHGTRTLLGLRFLGEAL